MLFFLFLLKSKLSVTDRSLILVGGAWWWCYRWVKTSVRWRCSFIDHPWLLQLLPSALLRSVDFGSRSTV